MLPGGRRSPVARSGTPSRERGDSWLRPSDGAAAESDRRSSHASTGTAAPGRLICTAASAALVAAWVDAGDHYLSICQVAFHRSHLYDTTSILKLIETRWYLTPLGDGGLYNALDLD
jgi:hypothetical protein